MAGYTLWFDPLASGSTLLCPFLAGYTLWCDSLAWGSTCARSRHIIDRLSRANPHFLQKLKIRWLYVMVRYGHLGCDRSNSNRFVGVHFWLAVRDGAIGSDEPIQYGLGSGGWLSVGGRENQPGYKPLQPLREASRTNRRKPLCGKDL